MKRALYLSLACTALLSAAEVTVDPIAVESTTLEDVSGEEIKSADVAEALAKKVPSITLVRRSGIANDIILRGQKKDNINVLIDDAKIYGACPNRMDPTTSHIATNNIESIEITEGPYDVENVGTLSGAVKITTKQPEEGVHGDVSLGAGSFGYQRAAGTITGGTERFKLLLSMSGETSGQYKDGDGNTFADQIDNFAEGNPALNGVRYQDQYRDMDAYTKLTGTAKAYINITDDQELRLGYMANRSDDILYPNSKMDALYDDSNLYTAEYIIRDIASFSKELSAQYYYSDVEHPMSTYYRVMADSNTSDSVENSLKQMTSKLTTTTQGAKIKNISDLTDNVELTVGLDTTRRNWSGTYSNNAGALPSKTGGIQYSISDVNTDNIAIFTELDNNFGAWNVKVGLRYDDTTITPSSAQQSNDYSALSANVFSTYNATSNLQFFGGLGKATRVPDARELYFYSAGNMMSAGEQVEVGTPDLDQTTNYEVDLGMQNKYENFTLKTKLFYSVLKNYIYYNSTAPVVDLGNIRVQNAFENIDATIYRLEITGSYYALDNLYADFGLAYQRGKKMSPLPVRQTPTSQRSRRLKVMLL